MAMVKHETPAALQAWLDTVGAAPAFGALLGAVPHAAVFAVDHERRVVAWSPGAEELLGYRAGEMIGEDCRKGNRCTSCMKGCGVQEHGTLTAIPLAMYRKDGSLVRVDKYARALRDGDGRFLGAVEVLVPRVEQARAGALPIIDDGGALDGDAISFHGILTRDPAMKRLFDTVKNVARTDAAVLLRGESGSGKELFARAIHDESLRKEGPYLAVNCAAIAPTLLESELFGHEKGAFTGAVQAHQGLFERAGGGTLFLDEVAELPSPLQAKLLRVLEGRSFTRVGGTRSVTVDVRVIAATHRSLRKEVAAGRFREDLMYRLRVVPLFIPPLRDRDGDVALLLEHFRAAHGGRLAGFSPDALRALLAWRWPGNVREVKNVVEYAAAVSASDVAGPADLPPEITAPDAAPAGRSPDAAPSGGRPTSGRRRAGVAPDEAARVRRALEETDGNVGEAARLLGMSRPTFWRRRKALGV